MSFSTQPSTADAAHEESWYNRRTIWRDVPMSQWCDRHWQMRNRITSAEGLVRVIPMTPMQQRTIERALDRFRFAVPTIVVDAPGGGGQIPVHPDYIVSPHVHKTVLRNFEGRIVAYEEPKQCVGMCNEGHPCSFCREILCDGEETVGVAGLFDDEPESIALVPSDVDVNENGVQEAEADRSLA